MGITPKKLSDQLRAAILAAPVTRYRISQDTGVNEGQLSRFVHRHVGLSLETVDVLVEYLDLELKPRQRKRRGK